MDVVDVESRSIEEELGLDETIDDTPATTDPTEENSSPS